MTMWTKCGTFSSSVQKVVRSTLTFKLRSPLAVNPGVGRMRAISENSVIRVKSRKGIV